MKIFSNKISKAIKITNRARYIKSEPYSTNSFQMTQKLEAKTSLWQRLRNFFGFRTKLNPKSFANGSHTLQKPFICSKLAAELSEEYLRTNYLSENQKIIDGFRDAGGGASFDNFGKVLYAKREVITIDKELDVYLQNAINYVKQNTVQMSEKKKLKFIYNLMLDISGDAQKAVERSELLGNRAAGEERLLGKIFEHGAAVCRHKALMFKILADEVGIKTRILRGNMMDFGGVGRHVWNEVKLKDGRKILIDIQNCKIIEVKNSSKNAKLVSYLTENNVPIYYK
ncbi:hypothetical protein HDR58_06460 [bacterium]|nr:hypothetical protein [bacterium]